VLEENKCRNVFGEALSAYGGEESENIVGLFSTGGEIVPETSGNILWNEEDEDIFV
jgi:hypothetical protein